MGWFGSKDANSFGVPYEGEITTDTFLEHLNQIEGTKNFRLLEGLKAVVEGPIVNLQQILDEKKGNNNILSHSSLVNGLVMDGVATPRLIDVVAQTNINVIVSELAVQLQLPENILVLTRTSLDSPEVREIENNRNKDIDIFTREREQKEKQRKIANAQDKEEHLDYDGSIEIYEEIGDKKSAKRIRKLKADLAAPKTEIHGDYVDDRDTIVKDSVINRSNIGAGGDDKVAKIKELKELLDSGAIDDDEFKQMKKEILGK